MKILFSPPDMSESEINMVRDTIMSGWITTGPKTKEFEKRIAAYCNVKNAVCLNAQTCCAEMMLRVLGVGKGDEVIVPAYTYTASASVIDHVGATIVLVDSQKDSFEMDYDKLEAAVTENTKAIIPVDIGGVPCDYTRIFEVAQKKKPLFRPSNKIQSAIGRVAICADSSHALGTQWHGMKTGSIADFTTFSFHAVKNLTTAEGGALVWKSIDGIDDDDIYQGLQLYSFHGQSKNALEKNDIGSWEYDVTGLWYKCNMTDVAASMGLAQLSRYDGMLRRRRQIIEKYDRAFHPMGILTLPHFTDRHTSCGHLYITRIPGIGPAQRQEIIVKMGERGIACNVHYKPLPMMTAYKNLGFDIKDFPNAYDFFKNEITLPLYTKLTDEETTYVADNYTDIVKEYLK